MFSLKPLNLLGNKETLIMKTVNLRTFYEGHAKVGHSTGKCLALTGISKLLARST